MQKRTVLVGRGGVGFSRWAWPRRMRRPRRATAPYRSNARRKRTRRDFTARPARPSAPSAREPATPLQEQPVNPLDKRIKVHGIADESAIEPTAGTAPHPRSVALQ